MVLDEISEVLSVQQAAESSVSLKEFPRSFEKPFSCLMTCKKVVKETFVERMNMLRRCETHNLANGLGGYESLEIKHTTKKL